MAIHVKMNDNSDAVRQQMAENVRRALTAMGKEAVGLISDGMDTLYEKPIWDTGDLHRNVNHRVREDDAAVDVGNLSSGDNPVEGENALEYAAFVHEGTYKMKARPYITDSLTGEYAKKRLMEIAKEYLKEKFDQGQ